LDRAWPSPAIDWPSAALTMRASMLLAFCDAAWRVVLVIGLALAPYAAPLDSVPSTTMGAALARLGAFLVLAVGLSIVVRRTVRRPKPLALAPSLTLVAAAVASFVFDGERGPLARATFFVAPFAWAAIAAALAGPIAEVFAKGKGASSRGMRGGAAA